MSTIKVNNPGGAAANQPMDGIQTPVQALIHFIISQELQLEQYDKDLAEKIGVRFLVTDVLGNEDPFDLVGEVIKWEKGDQQLGSLEHTLETIFTISIKPLPDAAG